METLQTRTESYRSLADREKYEALATLTELGLLIPVADIPTYHGRARKSGEGEWEVDPRFANGGNDSGNWNVNGRPTLYTASSDIAGQFAQARNHGGDKNVEIHDIVSTDTEARIIDNSFFALGTPSEENMARLQEALRALLPEITEGSPLDWADRELLSKFKEYVEFTGMGYFTNQAIEELSERLDGDYDAALQLAGAVNARYILPYAPTLLARTFVRHAEGIVYEDIQVTDKRRGQRTESLAVNLEYVASFMRNAHIVGVREWLNSGTLRRPIDAVSFFDLEKISTAQSLERQSTERQRMGNLAHVLGRSMEELPRREPLLQQLNNPYAKPQELLAAAKQVPLYKVIFEMETGVWEGFTLEQHTETVLRNFDENYADKLPVELLSVMRLAIICHDIGKPAAVREGDWAREADYNAAFAAHYMNTLQVDEKMQQFIQRLIGPIQGKIMQLDILSNTSAEADIRTIADSAMKELLGGQLPSQNDQQSFIDCARMLQMCDGGAYTSMAVTRTSTGSHRNSPSFNTSFQPPSGITRRTLARKPLRDTGLSADANLTPGSM